MIDQMHTNRKILSPLMSLSLALNNLLSPKRYMGKRSSSSMPQNQTLMDACQKPAAQNTNSPSGARYLPHLEHLGPKPLEFFASLFHTSRR